MATSITLKKATWTEGQPKTTHLSLVKAEQKILTKLKIFVHLSDVYRQLYPKKKTFTYSNLTQGSFSRIYRIYISTNCKTLLSSISHIALPSNISDHDNGVVLTMKSTMSAPQGPGVWKLNASLLKKQGCNLECCSTSY